MPKSRKPLRKELRNIKRLVTKGEMRSSSRREIRFDFT